MSQRGEGEGRERQRRLSFPSPFYGGGEGEKNPGSEASPHSPIPRSLSSCSDGGGGRRGIRGEEIVIPQVVQRSSLFPLSFPPNRKNAQILFRDFDRRWRGGGNKTRLLLLLFLLLFPKRSCAGGRLLATGSSPLLLLLP